MLNRTIDSDTDYSSYIFNLKFAIDEARFVKLLNELFTYLIG